MMLKKRSERLIRVFCHERRHMEGQAELLADTLCFELFHRRLTDRHPQKIVPAGCACGSTGTWAGADRRSQATGIACPSSEPDHRSFSALTGYWGRRDERISSVSPLFESPLREHVATCSRFLFENSVSAAMNPCKPRAVTLQTFV